MTAAGGARVLSVAGSPPTRPRPARAGLSQRRGRRALTAASAVGAMIGRALPLRVRLGVIRSAASAVGAVIGRAGPPALAAARGRRAGGADAGQ